jgi:hypothetical protein
MAAAPEKTGYPVTGERDFKPENQNLGRRLSEKRLRRCTRPPLPHFRGMASGQNPPRLVIFGCGYLGRAVAALGRAKGWSIEALTRNPGKAAHLRDELGLRVVEGDLASSDWHTTLEPENAFVVNCVSSGGGGEAGYAHSYREGMKSLVRWAARGRPRAVAYTSSTSVYPDAAGAWVDETNATAETPRARILLEAEEILRRAPKTAACPRSPSCVWPGFTAPSGISHQPGEIG